MKNFVLRRKEDETGVSGVGDVAEGVMFTDGTVALRWKTKHRSTCTYDSIADVVAIHGHNGKTLVLWQGVFARGLRDAMQDRIENCMFASVGGSNIVGAEPPPRDQWKAPDYVGAKDSAEYLEGYVAFVDGTYPDTGVSF